MMPDPHGSALFDTAIGACALSWTPRGVAAVQLPHACPDDTLRALRRRLPAGAEVNTPSPEAQHAIDGIRAVLNGTADPLSTVVLDLESVPAFPRRVYTAARAVPPGTTTTYGEIATALAAPGAARAVGQALGRNPFPIVVPCHRVLAAGGKPGGFSAHGGRATKQRLLSIERPTPTLFDDDTPHA